MKTIERDWNWWAYFWRVIHRQTLPGIEKWDQDVVRFIIKVMGCKKGDRLLDLGCGGGEHTRLLTKKAIKCDGIELAKSLVRYARAQARKEKVKVKYINGDMRKIDYDCAFDYAIMIGNIFGFSSRKENLGLLKKIKRALKPNGKLLFDIRNSQRKPDSGRNWFLVDDGFLLLENKFDAKTCRERGKYIFIDISGRVQAMSRDLHKQSSHIYGLSEVKTMLRSAGLTFVDAYAGYNLLPIKFKRSSTTSSIVVCAQK